MVSAGPGVGPSSAASASSLPADAQPQDWLSDCPPGDESSGREHAADDVPKVGDRVFVIGPECEIGSVSYEEMFGGGAEGFARVLSADGETIGFWYQRWFTIDQYRAVDGDPEADRYGAYVQ